MGEGCTGGECFSRKFRMYLYTPTDITCKYLNEEPAATVTFTNYSNLFCGNPNKVEIKFLSNEISARDKALIMSTVL